MKNNNFSKYQLLFNTSLNNILNKEGLSNDLYNMITYALDSGKRLRPIISIDMCLSLGGKLEDVINFAVAIELIHNASLIIDDLPCMDNDDYRRNNLSFHKKFSGYKAQIVSNIMIQLAMKLIYKNFKYLEQPVLTVIINNIVKNIGILGAAGGQLIDLASIYIDNKKELLNNFKDKSIIKDLFNKKTGSFFEISFIGGYLSGGGDISNLGDIKLAANNFGMAFQIYDDFDDIEQDKERVKNNLLDPNYINNFGRKEAILEFNNSKNKFIEIMKKCAIYSSTMEELIFILNKKISGD